VACEKCVTCGSCGCKCTCNKDAVKDNSPVPSEWDKFLAALGSSKKIKDNTPLPDRFTLTLVDNGVNGDEWGMEFTIDLNIIEAGDVLSQFFGIKAEAIPLFGVVGFIEVDDKDTEEEEE